MSWENDPAWYTHSHPETTSVVPDEQRCEFMVLPALRCPRRAQWDTRQIGNPLAGGRWCFHHSDLMRMLWEEIGVKARVSPISDS